MFAEGAKDASARRVLYRRVSAEVARLSRSCASGWYVPGMGRSTIGAKNELDFDAGEL